ncbi:hypothetical protein OpiT1DRAFT_05449 [Opitutaceae bacterium TAV1]|nr:hypothetical protein OpiT1DRAFT_05444 [Opitutaceae bacterium TAV1]EIQ00892.1 hypothetical protein OpiT1DRAFT_05449 [Opitutaceae bacterium TAV1]
MQLKITSEQIINKLILTICACVLVSGCSSLKTHTNGTELKGIQQERFRLTTRTDSGSLDKIVYEAIYLQFSDALTIAEKEPYSGSMEVSFFSSDSHGSPFRWQNSTMIIVLKNNSGERLWLADYKYKGGWEFSGWVVNTPDEAARLLAERLKERFVKDFQ